MLVACSSSDDSEPPQSLLRRPPTQHTLTHTQDEPPSRKSAQHAPSRVNAELRTRKRARSREVSLANPSRRAHVSKRRTIRHSENHCFLTTEVIPHARVQGEEKHVQESTLGAGDAAGDQTCHDAHIPSRHTESRSSQAPSGSRMPPLLAPMPHSARAGSAPHTSTHHPGSIGRVRHVPHVAGNFATHVFLRLPLCWCVEGTVATRSQRILHACRTAVPHDSRTSQPRQGMSVINEHHHHTGAAGCGHVAACLMQLVDMWMGSDGTVGNLPARPTYPVRAEHHNAYTSTQTATAVSLDGSAHLKHNTATRLTTKHNTASRITTKHKTAPAPRKHDSAGSSAVHNATTSTHPNHSATDHTAGSLVTPATHSTCIPGGALHLSLSRVCYLRRHDLTAFLEGMQSAVHRFSQQYAAPASSWRCAQCQAPAERKSTGMDRHTGHRTAQQVRVTAGGTGGMRCGDEGGDGMLLAVPVVLGSQAVFWYPNESRSTQFAAFDALDSQTDGVTVHACALKLSRSDDQGMGHRTGRSRSDDQGMGHRTGRSGRANVVSSARPAPTDLHSELAHENASSEASWVGDVLQRVAPYTSTVLSKLVRRVDKVVCRFGGRRYYRPPRFHASFAIREDPRTKKGVVGLVKAGVHNEHCERTGKTISETKIVADDVNRSADGSDRSASLTETAVGDISAPPRGTVLSSPAPVSSDPVPVQFVPSAASSHSARETACQLPLVLWGCACFGVHVKMGAREHFIPF